MAYIAKLMETKKADWRQIVSFVFKKVSFFAVLLMPVFLVFEKIGFRKWHTSNSPITWAEFVERLPKLFLFFFATYLAFLGAGLILGFMTKNKIYENANCLVCPKCESAYRKSETKNGKCPKCLVSLEKIEGFYQRHPELKG